MDVDVRYLPGQDPGDDPRPDPRRCRTSRSRKHVHPRARDRLADATRTCARCATRSAARSSGEALSVGRDGASDAVSFLEAGIPAVEFGPSAAATTGPRSGSRWPRCERYRAGARRLRARAARVARARPRRRGRRLQRDRGGLRVTAIDARSRASAARPPELRVARGMCKRVLLAARARRRADRDRDRDGDPTRRSRTSSTTSTQGRDDRSSVEQTSSRRADAGEPQTILVLGSDQRFARPSADDARSDTMMLVRARLRPNATRCMSIPRDLKVDIPGHGIDKINAAYSIGGPRADGQDGQALLSTPGNSRSTTSSTSTSAASARRSTRSAASTSTSTAATTTTTPARRRRSATRRSTSAAGYQRLCGQDSLDYVRFRHPDTDFVRAARQQDFLRQAKSQIGVASCFFDKPREARAIFGRYTQTDQRCSPEGC